MLEEKRAARKKLKSRIRKKATKHLIRRAKRYVAARRKSQEAKKEAEETKAEQQEEEAEKAESSEADPAATEWVGCNRNERCIKRIVREWHSKERLAKPATPVTGETSEAVADKAERLCRPGKPAPPAAGETSAAAADSAERLCRMAGYKIPRRVSPVRKCYLESFETLPIPLDGCIVRAPETTQERFLFGILVDSGMVLSGRQAKDYIRPHFQFQRREDNRKFYSD